MGTGPSLQKLVATRFKGPPGFCSPLAPLSMTAICLPYAIRFVQCLIVYRTTGNTNQVWGCGLELTRGGMSNSLGCRTH